jgi:hypothetical protein
MSGNPIAALIFAAALVVIGGIMALFPNNPVLQVKDLGRKFGNVHTNTRSFGIALFLLGLMLISLVRSATR